MTTADDADPHFTKHRFQMFIPPENRLKHALAARIRPIAPATVTRDSSHSPFESTTSSPARVAMAVSTSTATMFDTA